MSDNSQIQNININSIIPNRFQPRISFDEKSLQELSTSIKENGIIEPLVLRQIGDKYEIIAGERRYKAATMAGLSNVPGIIINIDDKKCAEIAITENIQRKSLNSIEEARAYKKILDKGYYTKEILAKKMGINEGIIDTKLKLLDLTKEVQNALMFDKISEGHAKSLMQINSPEKQVQLLNRTINERLTLKDLDEIIKSSNEETTIEKVIQNDTEYKLSKEINNEIESSIDEIKPVENPQVDNPNEFTEEKTQIEAASWTNDLDDNIFNNEENFGDENKKDPLKRLLDELEKKQNTSSLEDEVTNLNIDSEDFFNPFKKDESYDNNNSIDNNYISPMIEDSPKEEKIIIEGNIDSIKKELEKIVNLAKESNFDIKFEDYDFADLYQVVIKVNKKQD